MQRKQTALERLARSVLFCAIINLSSCQSQSASLGAGPETYDQDLAESKTQVEQEGGTFPMKRPVANWQFLLAAFYTWTASVFFGAVLLDIVYFNAASSALKPSETIKLFSEAADFLLLILALTLLAGIVTVVATWKVGHARNLFIASLLLVTAEFLAPMLLFSIIEMAQASLGFNVGSWVRLTLSALPPILAFLGLWKLNS
jgi:hypothetical protein